MGLFALDRILKIMAVKGVSLSMGPLVYAVAPISRIFPLASAREGALILLPPIIFLFWAFWKCGGMKPRIWSFFAVAGMLGMTFDILLQRGLIYCFSFASSSGEMLFNPATIWIFLSIITGIIEMVIQASQQNS